MIDPYRNELTCHPNIQWKVGVAVRDSGAKDIKDAIRRSRDRQIEWENRND